MPEPLFIRSQLLSAHGFQAIFSLREGGFSQPPFDSLNLADDTGDDGEYVEKNLEKLIQTAGFSCPPHRANQVHGHRVLTCHGHGTIHPQQADILLSEDGSPVAVRVADCTPILIADPIHGRCTAVHAGWRGTAQSVVKHAVEALRNAGGQAADFVASIGPCIGACCFEIGAETADALRTCCKGAENYTIHKNDKQFSNLAAINALQLHSCGLQGEHIESIAEQQTCTCCHADKFFSYRRDGQRSGRHLAIVASKMPA